MPAGALAKCRKGYRQQFLSDIHNIAFIEWHSLHGILYITIVMLHSLDCIHYILYMTLHCIYYIISIILQLLPCIYYIVLHFWLNLLHYRIAFRHFLKTLKLDVNWATDIVRYGYAIAAKKLKSIHEEEIEDYITGRKSIK